jgi:hypothetical protein
MPTGLLRFIPAFPSFSFMAFAPLDAWARLLSADRAWRKIPARYWPRVFVGLTTSTLGTVFTLPERLILAPSLANMWRRRKQAGGLRSDAEGPPIVFVLGYYRSGTTHLHYLLSCDPQLSTPKWYQMLAPQGSYVSWTLLRFFLVPFLSSKRPQDDVAYGPEYPAEDDFGLCNWGAIGTMPGRMILPGCWEHYKRYHTLEGLSDSEREEFRDVQTGLTWKLGRLAGKRGLLLKSPAHTARVRELVHLYGSRAKFIHLHREPVSVLRSNVAMHRRFEPFLLQGHPGDEVIRARIIDEYGHTERAFLRDADELLCDRPGSLARVRYEDLIADPVGEIHRAYSTLGLQMTPVFATRLVSYLHSVESYRAASHKGAGEGDGRDRIEPAPELKWMNDAFGHDRPAIPKRFAAERARELVSGSQIEELTTPPAKLLRPTIIGAVVALLFACAWIALASTGTNRNDWMVWFLGIAVGIAMLKAAGRGSVRLGWIAGSIVLIVFVLRAMPATYVSEPRYHHPSPDRWTHVYRSTRDGVLTLNNMFWLGLGVMTAVRFASREHVRPPGL